MHNICDSRIWSFNHWFPHQTWPTTWSFFDSFFLKQNLYHHHNYVLMTSHHIISNISDRHKTKHTQYTSNLSFIATSENPYETLTTMVDGAPRHWFPSRILVLGGNAGNGGASRSVELFDGKWPLRRGSWSDDVMNTAQDVWEIPTK